MDIIMFSMLFCFTGFIVYLFLPRKPHVTCSRCGKDVPMNKALNLQDGTFLCADCLLTPGVN